MRLREETETQGGRRAWVATRDCAVKTAELSCVLLCLTVCPQGRRPRQSPPVASGIEIFLVTAPSPASFRPFSQVSLHPVGHPGLTTSPCVYFSFLRCHFFFIQKLAMCRRWSIAHEEGIYRLSTQLTSCTNQARRCYEMKALESSGQQSGP